MFIYRGNPKIKIVKDRAKRNKHSQKVQFLISVLLNNKTNISEQI
jgi:hypothetical protein